MINQSEKHVHDPLSTNAKHLRVHVGRQEMEVLDGQGVAKIYPVSTSRFGLGTEPGSQQTPLGRFAISEKIGQDAESGAVFKSRKFTGEIAAQGGEEDLILTRILWLEGLEEANANTKERYIYIHGTNQESQIGAPASHGCVRMRNADIVELFREIPEGSIVEILV